MKKYHSGISFPLLLSCIVFTTAYAQPHANFSVASASGCGPLLVRFTNLSTGTSLSSHWVFDGAHAGDTSNLTNPLWVYNTPGYYNVKLVVTDGSGRRDSMTMTRAVFVATQPTVRFTASDTVYTCPPATITFTNTSDTGGCTPYYTWFIDSAHIHTTNATYTFTRPGLYSISLRETDSCGCVGSETKTNYIKIDSFPTVCFNSTDTAPCAAPTRVCFNNCTSGGTRYAWHFGDGTSDTTFAPCHTYSTISSFTDTLIAYSRAGCMSSLVRPNYIRIGYAGFGFYTVPSTVCLGDNFTCVDTSTAGSHHRWRFSSSPGDTSLALSPTFSYYTPGYQTIVDSVWSDAGCTGTAVSTILVNPTPDATFAADSVYRCGPNDTVHFTLTGSASAAITAYAWNFGDPPSGAFDTSSAALPTHIYRAIGDYTPSLRIYDTGGCSAYSRVSAMISIAPPWDTLIVDTISGCLPFPVHYTIQIVPALPFTVDSVTFGDGTYATTDTGTHVYTTSGLFRIHYYYTVMGMCHVTGTRFAIISAGALPTITRHSISDDTICPSIPVIVIAHCVGCTNSRWVPVHASAYISPGSRNDNAGLSFYQWGMTHIKFYAINFGCVDSVEDSVYVLKPGAAFTMSQPNCHDPYTIRFTNITRPLPDHWIWNFGDGTTDTALNPLHTYTAAGTYYVVMSDTSDSTHCFSKFIRSVEIMPYPAAPFVVDSLVCVGEFAIFSTFRPFKSTIFFGDGVSDTASSVTYHFHPYDSPGYYDIMQILKNQFGCVDTIYGPRLVHVVDPARHVSGTPVTGCPPLLVHFHDSTTAVTGLPVPYRRWLWDLPDTPYVRVYGIDTSHVYSEGLHYAVMEIQINSRCVAYDTVPINVIKPHAWFTTDYVDGCPSMPITFHDTNSFCTYVWDFGDGSAPGYGATVVHAYSAIGIYSPSVTITTTTGGIYPPGCTDSVVRTSLINISHTSTHLNFVLSDTAASCPPFIVLCNNTTSSSVPSHFKWKFGFDSTTINSTLVNATAVYTYPGNYTITLIDSNDLSCIDSMKRSVHVGGPTGVFTFTPDTICVPGFTHLHLMATSAHPLDSYYVWFVPPYGAFLTDTPGISIYYSYPGVYNPYVIIDSDGCQVPIYTHDSIYAIPPTHITVTHPGVTCGVSVVINATGSTYYTWTPASGLSCTTCSSVIAFPSSMTTYTVVGSNVYGCKDSATVTVFIDTPHAVVITGPAHLCIGKCDTLHGHSVVGSYEWYGSALSCFVCENQVVCPVTTSIYTLVVTDTFGCKDTGFFKLFVEPLPNIYFTPNPIVVCFGDSTTVMATGAATYIWRPNIGITCDTCGITRLFPPSNLVYSVTGTSIYGCVSESSAPVTVLERTGFQASADTTICVGSTIQLHSRGGISYLWLNPYKLSDAHSPSPYVNPDTTITYVELIRENACFTDTARVKVTVAPIPEISMQTYTIIAGTRIQLHGHTNNGVKAKSFTWAPADDLTCEVCPSPIATPTANTTYTVTIISTDGCSATTTFNITMRCDNSQVFVPNTFTPNMDGVNDRFYISGHGISIIRHVAVYDRWGELIYEAKNIQPNDPSAGWDGTFHGRELTPDVFVYKVEALCEMGEIFNYQGSITLIR